MTKQCPKRSTIIKTISLPDGYVVLANQKTQWATTVSPLGALIWEFCDGLHSEEDILSQLKSIPEVAEIPDLSVKVAEALKQMADDGLFNDDEVVSSTS